ncbi:MAG: T9SS type A sorting domain-containing protein [Chitinophagales bacterium]|nr:T9SS type A sorting domain-containing protein [Chitinophagales bacterium]
MNLVRTVTVSDDAVGPFGYSLVSKDGPFQSTNTFTGLGVGVDPSILEREYTVYVRDVYGCVDSCGFIIRQNSQLQTTLSKTDLLCHNYATGSVTATVTGGKPPYRFHWSNGIVEGPTMASTSSIAGLAAGSYAVTILDANDCEIISSVVLTQPDRIVTTIDSDVICLDHLGSGSVSASGGSGTYYYTWYIKDPGTTGLVAGDLIDAGTSEVKISGWDKNEGYADLYVRVEDGNDCPVLDSVRIYFKPCFDLAIRKRVEAPLKQHYPGDVVYFTVEVFNQGSVDALNVKIIDIPDDEMSFSAASNLASVTGNPNDWVLDSGGFISTLIPRINSKEKAIVRIALKINEHTTRKNMINYVRIIDYDGEIVFGTDIRIKNKPKDEDDLSDSTDPNDFLSEVDDEICDSENIAGECTRDDNPDDEDQLDFAVVSICPGGGAFIDQEVCLTSIMRTTGIPLHTPAIYDLLDPEGNGNGVLDNDNGNKIVSLHNSLLESMSGINPITGKIVFGTGTGGASNGQLQPNGNLQVNANQEIKIYARLVALDECLSISVLTYHFTSQPEIVNQPRDVTALIDEENVCFTASVQNPSGIPYTLQWQESIKGTFVDLPGANSEKLCIDTAKVDYDHRIFRLMTYSTEDLNRTCVNTSGSVYLDVGGEPTLACNDLVQISLDVNCTALITPEMINKGAYNSSRFYIKIVDKHGNVVPNPVTGEYIGQLLTVYVRDRISGNSCWGMVTIEDKLPPVIECPLDYTVSCANIAFVPPFPVFRDGCDANATIELISSTLTEYECGRQDDIIAKKVFTFVAKDRFGNASSPCYVTVYFTRGNVHNIQWPDNVNLSCRVAPGYPVWDVNRNDYPDVSETGVPKVDGLNLAVYQDGKLLSNTLCHVNVTYVDEQVALCGNSFKVIRTWTLLDWCTREVKNHSQFIVVMDNEAPQLDCPKGQSIKIFTDAHSCTGTLLVPAPKVISDCNDTHWSIAYSVSSNNVSLPEDQIYITDNVVFNGRDYYIVDLPQGKTWIRYSVVDACDNLAYCYVEVEVIDNIKPVPVCDKHTVVTLNESGNGRLFAQSIDDGSHDNCSKVTFAIRRMKNNCGVPSDADWTATYLGNKYYSYVDFCCLDLNSNLQQVELLVIDEVGNMNTCMTWVEIQNKILPILTCPHDITLDCESPYTPTDLNSFATFSSGCPLYFLDFEDVIDDLKCGEKNIKRNWRVRQKADGKTVVSCVQRILIRNLSPFDLNSVIFPPNVTLVNQCKGVSAFLPDNPATGGYPTWTSIGCSQVAASYRDEVYEVVPDACFKILRYWTVIDWCTHDLTDESTVRNHIQVIKVVDTEKPKINCQDLRFEITEGCSKLVTLIGESEDGCTPADKMRYSHSLNGEPFIQSGIFNRNLTPGEHKLTWIAEDRCGNIDTCSQKIIIVDGKKPSPYCITVLSTVLMPTSLKIDLWAKDFDHGATDNCSQQLRFTFGPNPPVSFARKHYYKNVNGVSVEATEGEYLSGRAELWDPALHSSSRMFNCEDVGLNELDIYVWDDAGNSDFCSVKVIIQDNSGLCAFSRSVIAEGTVIAVNGMPMSNVDTYITNVLNNEAAGVTTDSAGFYLYNKMLNNVPYKVEPVKSDDYLNGLTTLDLVLIQRHILGVELISDPKLLLAADVNQDGKVSASDLSVIRKLILGISTTLPNNRSWIFVANDGMISDNPWDWLQNATFTALNNTTFTNDFTGIKLGDINMSAFLSGNGQFVTSRSQIIPLIINKREVKAGKEESLSVSIKDIDAITSLQLSIELKPGTHFVKMIPGLLDIKQEHYNLINRDGRQILNISWNQSERLDIPSNGILFDLVIQTDSDMKTDEILQMTNTIPAELSDQLLRTYPVKLRYKDIHHDANVGLIVYQNVPNPFIQSTTVRYHVKAAGKVDARVTDLDGRLIYSYEQEAKSGYNELVLNKNIFNHKSGMYLLTISTSLESKTIKMILTEY